MTFLYLFKKDLQKWPSEMIFSKDLFRKKIVQDAKQNLFDRVNESL